TDFSYFDNPCCISLWITSVRQSGLEQLDGYLARLEQDEGWLVIFDRLENTPELEERLHTEIHLTPMGRSVTVIRA
ncbi:MAG: hypothetical protein WCD18_07780, partial [Thermosynechococcaceae cyanobacterium]